MSAENFKILKEFNSLTLKCNELSELMNKELKRLNFIEDNRAQREEELNESELILTNLKKEMLVMENEINALNSKIEKDKSNLLSLIDDASIKSMEKQIQDLDDKKDHLENDIFELLEKSEVQETIIKEAQSFLTGSLRSLTEIKKEVTSKNEDLQKEIDSLTKRLELLKESLPQQFQNKLEQVLKNNIQISSFTRIKSNTCEFCRRDISRMEETEIEQKLALKTCQGCGRLFIPAAASF